MEQNFQTSFIPKKPIVAERAMPTRSVNFFTIISIFVLFTVLIASAGLYFYKGVMAANIKKMESDLSLAKNRFEPSKITELKLLDKRLYASSELLGKHIAVTPIFTALGEITMKTVRYTKFGYDLPSEKDGKITVRLSGMAVGYRSIALQSDLFAKNKNLIDPVFSNLSLDDRGNVLFDLQFAVDPAFVDYKKVLETQN